MPDIHENESMLRTVVRPVMDAAQPRLLKPVPVLDKTHDRLDDRPICPSHQHRRSHEVPAYRRLGQVGGPVGR